MHSVPALCNFMSGFSKASSSEMWCWCCSLSDAIDKPLEPERNICRLKLPKSSSSAHLASPYLRHGFTTSDLNLLRNILSSSVWVMTWQIVILHLDCCAWNCSVASEYVGCWLGSDWVHLAVQPLKGKFFKGIVHPQNGVFPSINHPMQTWILFFLCELKCPFNSAQPWFSRTC